MKISIPTPTEVRKIGSTEVAKNCTEAEMRMVARQMSHDPRVAAQYYQHVRGAEHAKKAYDTMESVIQSSSSEVSI